MAKDPTNEGARIHTYIQRHSMRRQSMVCLERDDVDRLIAMKTMISPSPKYPLLLSIPSPVPT